MNLTVSGVSYSLNVDIHQNYMPATITEEQTKVIKEIAHATLERIMTDFIEAHNRGDIDNTAAMV